ncbi:methyltransferase [Owenweeksia hongkongensis]|uniref:methyltransferase n=1 Tax=Owenweeksia hongkongensis TaxID=253245 RepID=UPI003A91E464
MKDTLSQDISAVEAKYEAQKIAFGPITFQCAMTIRNTGILKAVADSRKEGISADDISKKTGISKYGVKVLLDMAASMKVVREENEHFWLLKTGYFLLNDRMTEVNMDFVQDVCYEGSYYLEEAIREVKPAGLKVLGEWENIYKGLAELPEQVRKSWFAFDHFYSDNAFPTLLEMVFKNPPRKLYDVGGNTGRWARLCVQHYPNVEVTILDLPGQLRDAKKQAEEAGLSERIHGHQIDLLDDNQPFPKGADVFWISQCLDCFSEEEILGILKRAAAAMTADTRLYILETYWDRQRFEGAEYSLNATSLYFTVMANGNSRMYHSRDMIKQVHAAGLIIDEDTDDIGLGHTLFRCRLA